MRPRILIAGKPDKVKNYMQALDAVGAEGVELFECTWKEAVSFSGLLLPGGGDIAPELFGQINQGSVNIDETLDRIQFKVLDEYCKKKKPVLGICKGIQLINVYFGGTILQHLSTAHNHRDCDGDQYHMTIATKDSLLTSIYGLRFSVNSAHHQGIGYLGAGLEAIQFAEDRVVEGIVHKELPIIGVQWHPERILGKREDVCDGGRLLEFWIQHFPTYR